jgi:NAD(P)-dependent dehydrogenase (short-subunit alcohol dehydrogenase family)
MDINVRGPFLWIQAVLPGMRARKQGRIINVTSLAAYTPMPYASSYCASKAALAQLTASLADEVKADGVVVLGYGPTALTDLSRNLFEDDAIPDDRRENSKAVFTTDPAEIMRLSLDVFAFLAAGGADDRSGGYFGQQPGYFETPESIAAATP